MLSPGLYMYVGPWTHSLVTTVISVIVQGESDYCTWRVFGIGESGTPSEFYMVPALWRRLV